MVFGYFIGRPFYQTTERTIKLFRLIDRSILSLLQLLLHRLTHSVLIEYHQKQSNNGTSESGHGPLQLLLAVLIVCYPGSKIFVVERNQYSDFCESVAWSTNTYRLVSFKNCRDHIAALTCHCRLFLVVCDHPFSFVNSQARKSFSLDITF